MTLLQRNSISSYDGLVESQAWLRTVPVNELANRVVVGALRTWRGEAVEHSRLGLLKIRKFKIVLGARFRFDLGVRAIATASFKPWQQR
jgi:hypothetical protein